MSPILTLFTIYQHPRDFPDEFVVRAFAIERGGVEAGHLIARASSLADVRALLDAKYPGLTCLPREAGDDPVIVETWV